VCVMLLNMLPDLIRNRCELSSFPAFRNIVPL
jgi:hypothetical protein